jgi:hypothetical protein
MSEQQQQPLLPVKHYYLIDDPDWDVKKNGCFKMKLVEQTREPEINEVVKIKHRRGPDFLGFKNVWVTVTEDTDWMDYDYSGDPEKATERGFITVVHVDRF